VLVGTTIGIFTIELFLFGPDSADGVELGEGVTRVMITIIITATMTNIIVVRYFFDM